MPLKILIDGDMFVFRACSSVEKQIDWGNDIWTLHVDLSEAKARFTDIADKAIGNALEKMKYSGNFETIFCFSSPTYNFRRKILPTYKANRTGKRKPVGYAAMVKWTGDNYQTLLRYGLEADDCMGIEATKDPKHSLIISGDKDLKSIPCYNYNFLKDTLTNIDEKEAMKFFYMQTLMGDPVDGYSGCPKIGVVTAEKLLSKDSSWKTVVNAYKKQGLSEEVALQQARVARILWNTDYDEEKGEVVLWRPTD